MPSNEIEYERSCETVFNKDPSTEHSKRCMIDLDRPLNYNDSAIKEVINVFKIEKYSTLKLARVNQIKKLDNHSNDYLMIKNYFENTNSHSRPIKISKAWSVYRKDRELDFVDKGFESDQRLLLWHGTKSINLPNILKRGLQIPSHNHKGPQAFGGLFGEGIYFADRMSKSARYTDESGPGLLLLCEVALGNMWSEYIQVDEGSNYRSLLPQHDSIKGIGNRVPDKMGKILFDRDIMVPCGKTITNPKASVPNPLLIHNEYIVFNAARILIKFIVQFDHDHVST